eukprot:scaffold15156_cov101-Isochrysis_galbana.AAC.1
MSPLSVGRRGQRVLLLAPVTVGSPPKLTSASVTHPSLTRVGSAAEIGSPGREAGGMAAGAKIGASCSAVTAPPSARIRAAAARRDLRAGGAGRYDVSANTAGRESFSRRAHLSRKSALGSPSPKRSEKHVCRKPNSPSVAPYDP